MKKTQAILFILLVTLFIISIGGLPLVSGFSRLSFVIQWVTSFIFGAYVIFLMNYEQEEKSSLLALVIIGACIFFVGLPIWLYEIKKDYLPFAFLQKSCWEFVAETNTVLFFLGAGAYELCLRLKKSYDVIKKME
jgi:hypothetical protein